MTIAISCKLEIMKSSEIQLGDISINLEKGGLTDARGHQIPLRFQAREVLRLLASKPNEVVERAALVAEIWQERQGGDEGLAQCIAEIRRALGDCDKTIVETIPRRGYRLAVSEAQPPVAATAHSRWWTIGGVAAALGMLALAVLWATGADHRLSSRSVIAVLPFEDLGPSDPALPLGDSVSEDIINSLARYSEFDVIARHSSFGFRDTSAPLRDIAEQLGANFLVQGSHVVQNGTLRISVQMIDASDLTNVWVDRFEVPLEDMFDVNDTIAYRVAHAISSSVVAINAAAARPEGQADALILDKRVRVLFQSAPGPDRWIDALALTQESIERFPESEWGYVGRALMLRIGVRFGWSGESTEDLLTEAETLARRAVELAPQNYITHFALGRVLMQQGEIERSVAALEVSAALNPSSITVLNALAQAYIYSDRLDDVHRVLERVARIDPIQDTVTLWMRAWSAWQGNDCEGALDVLQAIPVIPPEALKLLSVVHLCLQDRVAAQMAARSFLERYPDWTLAREVETNARNWTVAAPRDRWLAALAEVGVPD